MLLGPLKAILINFHPGDEPSVDIDNMAKPVLDSMHEVVYGDDRQIRQAEIMHINIGSDRSLIGVSRIIVESLQVGRGFVYARIEDPIDPYPLPVVTP